MGTPKNLMWSRDMGIPKSLLWSRDIGIPKCFLWSRDMVIPKCLLWSKDMGIPKCILWSRDTGIPKCLVWSRDMGTPPWHEKVLCYVIQNVKSCYYSNSVNLLHSITLTSLRVSRARGWHLTVHLSRNIRKRTWHVRPAKNQINMRIRAVWPRGYKTFFMLNSAEHKNYFAYKSWNTDLFLNFFHAQLSLSFCFYDQVKFHA